MQNRKSIKIPQHIAIILDGNRRWAREHNLSIYEGHWRGMKNMGKIIKVCADLGVKILTVYAFSTENQKRSEEEKQGLFKIFRHILKTKRKEFKKNSVRIKILGDISYFPRDLQKEIIKTVEFLKEGKKFQLNVALNYGGRVDILQAVKKIIESKVSAENITEDLISKNLYTSGDSDPDLIIRPGGEMRLSNFLIWQASYAELYFTSKLWPEFDEKELDKAIKEYDRRERRFGR
ncbi:MAG: polyprenyl diphosphate synthase [Patescibacteria group bacterium]